ncbi:hypothetical protein NP493_129g03027 [Ridgeia piscesae]|uniref:Uncharacterized protein n=1 Tax=Ridgeia piscesae TaxID=27915 RepID=A0AAD9P5J4_RIDPI|nr:hypothetical protein NP493_129g03027 [Ridgeia piscesae]
MIRLTAVGAAPPGTPGLARPGPRLHSLLVESLVPRSQSQHASPVLGRHKPDGSSALRTVTTKTRHGSHSEYSRCQPHMLVGLFADGLTIQYTSPRDFAI